MLDEKEVKHVAKLARVDLTDEEVKRFGGQLNDVMQYMDILNEVDTEGIEGTNQVTGSENVMESDEVLSSQSSSEELLGCSELPVDSNQVRVKRIV